MEISQRYMEHISYVLSVNFAFEIMFYLFDQTTENQMSRNYFEFFNNNLPFSISYFSSKQS